MKAIINVGISGSGKTHSNAFHPEYIVISKDIYRKLMTECMQIYKNMLLRKKILL